MSHRNVSVAVVEEPTLRLSPRAAVFLLADGLPADVDNYRASGYLDAAIRTAGEHLVDTALAGGL